MASIVVSELTQVGRDDRKGSYMACNVELNEQHMNAVSGMRLTVANDGDRWLVGVLG
jgi:hypothetical protein